MRVYIDTSAAAKLLVEEAESEALAGYLDSLGVDAGPFSSTLLATEIRRAATRLRVAQWNASELLSRVGMVEPERSLFHEAGLLPGAHLRSLDAIHLATALRIDADVIVVYDHRLLAAAREVGLATASPGS